MIAPSKPFDKFLSHNCPHRAIFTDSDTKAIELLTISPSIQFLSHYGYKFIFPACILGGQAKEAKISKWYLRVYVKMVCVPFFELGFPLKL